MMKFLIQPLMGIAILTLLIGCESKPTPMPVEEPVEVVVPIDTLTVVEHLKERGMLRAVTNRQHLNYRLLEGRPAGFQFELLDGFCEQLGVKLNLLVNDSIMDCYRMLAEGSADLFAGIVDSTDFYDTTFCHFAIDPPIAMKETFVWIIPNQEKDSSMLQMIDDWFAENQDGDMRSSFYRYFPHGKSRASLMIDDKHISPFDDIIKAEAKRIHWDWRLVASIIYQESRFKLDLESSQGAYGLMQLMPAVMDNYGIDCDSPAEDQIKAGCKLLAHLERELPKSINDSLERQKFVLAAYNTGLGNVMVIRKKTEKKGKDPNVWDDNVALYSPRQTFHFVRDILERYSHYQALIEP